MGHECDKENEILGIEQKTLSFVGHIKKKHVAYFLFLFNCKFYGEHKSEIFVSFSKTFRDVYIHNIT